jgi:hypothetical protein
MYWLQIKDNRRADKITSGPQSHILEGVSWEEAKKLQVRILLPIQTDCPSVLLLHIKIPVHIVIFLCWHKPGHLFKILMVQVSVTFLDVCYICLMREQCYVVFFVLSKTEARIICYASCDCYKACWNTLVLCNEHRPKPWWWQMWKATFLVKYNWYDWLSCIGCKHLSNRGSGDSGRSCI